MTTILSAKCFCMSSTGSDGTNDMVAVKVCGHVFHRTCLLEWWKNKQTCPSCNQQTKKKGNQLQESLMIRLFNVEAHAIDRSRDHAGGISSDGFLNQTQDTQQILDEVVARKRGRPSKDKKGKGKMVIHDDEEEEEGEEQKEEEGDNLGQGKEGKEVVRLRKELRETKNTVRDQRTEAEQYRLQCIKLEESLKPLDEQLDLLKDENSANIDHINELEAQLASLNADVLEETERLLEAVEADNKKLTLELGEEKERFDRMAKKARARKQEVEKLEKKLRNEGSEGGIRIAELEAELDEKERSLMLTRAVVDKAQNDVEKAKEAAEKRIKQIGDQAKARVDRAQKLMEDALKDEQKGKQLIAQLRLGNKNWESKYKKLKSKHSNLSASKKGVVADSDDSDSDNLKRPRPVSHSPAPIRQPLASTSSHNYLASSSPPAAYKIKNMSSLTNTAKALSPVKRPALAQPADESEEEEDIYAPVVASDGEMEQEQMEDEIEGEPDTENSEESDDDDVIFMDEPSASAPIASKPQSKSQQLSLGDSTVSKHFPRSSSQKTSFPIFGSASTTKGGVLGKRPLGEKSKSDRWIPDFSNDKKAIAKGPVTKKKRKI